MDDPRTFFQGDPSDTRFQFEVIKQLAESIRQQAEVMRGIQEDMRQMQREQAKSNERLAAIEANRINETVAKQEERLETACVRIDKLEQDKDRRDGAGSFLGGLFKYGPAVFSLLTLLYLFGRSIGVVPSPPTTATIATPAVIERRGEGEPIKEQGNVH